jgi:hypothetical protein
VLVVLALVLVLVLKMVLVLLVMIHDVFIRKSLRARRGDGLDCVGGSRGSGAIVIGAADQL